LQEANITQLPGNINDAQLLSVSTQGMNDQQQSFKALVNSTVNQFLADCDPATVQDSFQMDIVLDPLTIYQLMNSTPN